MKKKGLLIPLALLLALSLVATACPAPEPPEVVEKPTYHWRMSTSMPAMAPEAISSEHFAESVLEASGGRIVIDVHPGAVLGDWVSVYEEIIRGTIELSNTCLSSTYDPRIGVVYTPYLTTGWEEAKVLYAPGGFVYDTVSDILRVQGIELLSSWPVDFMGVGIRGELPPSPKDPDVDKGLKVRVWADPAPEGIMEWFGYMPTVLPWTEVYSSLQMGVIDGVCTNLTSAYSVQRDLIDYWIYDHSLFEGNFFLINGALYNSLSPEDQKIIRDAALEEQRIRMETAEQVELENLQKFRDQGTEVILFTPEEVAKFRMRAIDEIWPKLYSRLGKTLMDRAAAYIEALK